jgi:hypothetical protein
MLVGAAVSLLPLITGCASEANRGTRISYDSKAPRQAVLQKPSPTLPLVVIRYPASARLDAENRPKLFSSIRKTWPKATDEQIEQLISEELAKTQYHTLEFYRILASRLPPDSVMLCPAVLDTDLRLKDNVVPPPHVLQVDMFATVNRGRVIANYCYGPDTSGNKISPVIEVLFRDVSSVDTLEYKRQFAIALGNPETFNRLPAADIVGETWQREYNANLDAYKKTLLPALKKMNGVPLENGVVFGFAGNPAQGWWTPGQELRRQINPTCSADQVILPNEGLWQGYSDAIIAVLNTVDWEKTASRRMQSFCHNIGIEKLASEDRNEVLSALIPAETTLIVKQDQTISEMLYANSFGTSVREQMLAELKVMDQIDASQNAEAVMGVLSLAAAGAAVGVQANAASSGNLTPQLNQQVMNVIQVSQQTMNSVSQAEGAFRNRVQTQLRLFTQRVSANQMVVMLNTSRGQFEIRGNGLEDIRTKIREKIVEVFGLSPTS